MSSPSKQATPSPLASNLDYISRATHRHRLYGTLSARRPWPQLFDHHSLSTARGLHDALTRLKTNLSFFRTNFAIIILLILFLSLLWHPISLIVFIAMMALWLFLYFLRDEPVVVLNRSVDDRFVLAGLSVLTVVTLLFTGATGNILISLAVGVGVVLVYSVFRGTDDLYLDEEGAVSSGLISGRVGSGVYKGHNNSSS